MKKYKLLVFAWNDDHLVKDIEITEEEYLEMTGSQIVPGHDGLGSYEVYAFAEIVED